MNKFFLMGTIALTGMTGLTACSSDDDVNGENGNGGQVENGVVKTQFALNVPYSSNGTRMNNQVTQQDQIFRGMQDMRILAFGENLSDGVKGYISLGKDDDAFESDPQRRIYRDIEVPVGTKKFLFYGSAKGNDNTDKFEYGCLEESGFSGTDTNIENIKFSLKNVTSNDSYTNSAKLVGNILNEFIDAPVTYTGTNINKKWYELTSTETNAQLKHAYNLYTKFIGLKSGSWNTVKSALEGLKRAIGTAPTETPTTWLQGFANNCQAALDKLSLTGSDVLNQKFPQNLNLPDGVAAIAYNTGTHQFEYNASVEMVTGNQINWSKISYPASLNYFVNTTVMANNQTIDGLTGWPSYSDWKEGKWDGTGTISGWGNEVLASTRSIGLKDAIQYGVANLQACIKAENSDLKDKDGTVIGIANGDNYYFKWTGVLVGGQPESVGWNYVSKANASNFGNTIYDNKLSEEYKVINGSYDTNATTSEIFLKSTEYSRVNNTLVLDNKSNDGNEATTVYVTLEFVNNSGKEFRGIDGIVPNGGKFYLVGKLTPKTNTEGGNLKDGTTTDASHIFVQDYTTKANFKISSLANAYNCIPDLRSSEIALGLAVDLTWKTGMEFDVTID